MPIVKKVLTSEKTPVHYFHNLSGIGDAKGVKMDDPYMDYYFLNALERWHHIRQSIQLPVNDQPPDHSRHLFCAFMYCIFRGQMWPLADFMAGKDHRGLTSELRRARELFYQYRLDER